MKEALILAYDIGTTGVKTCLFKISQSVDLIGSAVGGYDLYTSSDGSAEQVPAEWWSAICRTTADVLAKTGISPDDIQGISFCSQMQGLVLVDKNGEPVRNAFSYMDQRAKEELKKGMANGIQIAGANIFKLIPSLIITGAVSASVKDPVWKYKWTEAHERENFKKVYKWLDVKEYIICKMTGKFVMTQDSAFGTLLYDIREGKRGWSKKICSLLGVNTAHLPEIVKSTDKVGGLTKEAAEQLGLKEGTAVFGGGGDASLIGIGAGATELGDTHVYSGTSGWVGTVVDRSIVDTNAMIAAIVGAQDGYFNYFAELETAGKCLEWVKDHLALDEINIYLKKEDVTQGKEAIYTSLYDYMTSAIADVPAGCGGVIFTPWLHGNRCPFEAPNARGMFFNISLETGKSELIRAVLEGVCYHLRWFIDTQDKKIKTSSVIRFVGGGALSDLTCQILSDCTGRIVETTDSPQNAGSVGAAMTVAAGLGIISDLVEVKKLIPAAKTFRPNAKNKAAYDKNYEVYKQLYKSNKANFDALNG